MGSVFIKLGGRALSKHGSLFPVHNARGGRWREWREGWGGREDGVKEGGRME